MTDSFLSRGRNQSPNDANTTNRSNEKQVATYSYQSPTEKKGKGGKKDMQGQFVACALYLTWSLHIANAWHPYASVFLVENEKSRRSTTTRAFCTPLENDENLGFTENVSSSLPISASPTNLPDESAESLSSEPVWLERRLEELQAEITKSSLKSSKVDSEGPLSSMVVVGDEESISLAAATPTYLPSVELSPVSSAVTRLLTLSIGTYVVFCVLSDLLSHYETIQNWRYVWPFGLGFWFLAESLSTSSALPDGNKPNSEVQRIPWLAFTIVKVVLAIGLMVGGAYDAWMPVYETGPNVVTAAGIGQDAAVGLYFFELVRFSLGTPDPANPRIIFGWTLGSPLPSSKEQDSSLYSRPKDENILDTMLSNPVFLQALLLGQLFKLGEGSFDELFFS